MDINSIIEMIEGHKYKHLYQEEKFQQYSDIYNEACDDIIEQLRKMSDEPKKIKIGEVFKHPHLGLVRYIAPDGKSCEIRPVNDPRWPRFPYWKELYDMGFDLEIK